ncbi:sigma 54-interacting transcriptional regulator [Fodinisporobacter ferrooxydans]|uniref:Sigma 54-interacting transcriptional regulator n=1 Tax=Fodinisporobacter ferrooxydans TaxID=2901836 RepID=A0ABY4CLH9_9BACL|nr:sigma 54-interacting transcriptional regulator [Alicyclobacillaceae bacterium MYW30-H2]
MSEHLIKQTETVDQKILNQETVKNWMTKHPFTVRPEDTLAHALKLLSDHHIDGLPVIDGQRRVIGLLTKSHIMKCYLNQTRLETQISTVMSQSVVTIYQGQTLTEAYEIPVGRLPVVDEHGMLVGILTRTDILQVYSRYLHRMKESEYTAEALSAVLESAYEGIVVCDADGVICEFNQAYCSFLGKSRDNVLGKHVTEIIENTRLHIVAKTGVPERGFIQRIQGQDMVVHRIPVWKEGTIIGAIGMLIFEGVTELYKILERMQHLSRQVSEKQLMPDSKSFHATNKQSTFEQIIGNSQEISDVKRIARKAAGTPATVLITGESGTGKEMFAKAIHYASAYAEGPFISMNCAAIPEQLLEAELFGYEDGAFTGARKGGKPGKFELADKGTLFLDEIGDMPLTMQSKILRVLQEREVERVGGITKQRVDVRIIAATNRNLEEMVKTGSFREDLFYRLNIIRLNIPALRDRKPDIPMLLSFHLESTCKTYGLQRKTFTQETISMMMEYEWPGNVRELINTVEMLVTLVEGQYIFPHDLPSHFWSKKQHVSDGEPVFHLPSDVGHVRLDQVKSSVIRRERDVILQILAEVKWNKAAAARALGIHRSTLYEKLKKYGIT